MTEVSSTEKSWQSRFIKALLLIVCLIIAINALSNFYNRYLEKQRSKPLELQQAGIAPQQASIDHYYSMRDGYLYGYEQAISQNDIEQGRAANTLLMFRYSGLKDGVYQVYTKDDALDVITVMECTNPCDFLKIITHVKHLDKPKVEHMRMTPGTIAELVFYDAMNGKLNEVVLDKNGKKNSMWIGEKGDLYQSEIAH